MSRGTTKAIMESFMDLLMEKSLDKITVKDIIETAEVNRNTFYYHFRDIYDLLESIFREESERFRNSPETGSSFYEEYVRLAGFLLENKQVTLHIYNSRSRKILQEYLEDSAEHFVRRFVKKAAVGTSLSARGEEYITYFYIYGIVALTIQWIEKGMPDYSKDLIRTNSDSFEATIDDMIRAYIAGHTDECQPK